MPSFRHIAMDLHARRKGTNAALLYFPCCAWSLIEDLPKASFCFIVISFFITPRCCLHSMNFSLLYRIESILKLYSIAQYTKFPFQRLFICPNRTPDKRVTSVLLRGEICPEISERATLNVFSITPCTGLQIRWFLMCCNVNLMELLDISYSSLVHLWTSSQIDEDNSIHRGIWIGWWFILQLSRHDFSFHYSNFVYMVSKNWAFPDMCFFKAISLTKRKAWSRFTKFIVNIRVHN
jgi:hypothetical protein